MTGINYADTIIVRRSVEKGTRIIEEKVHPLTWAGQEFKDLEHKRLEKAGNIKLVSGKGTKTFFMSSMADTQIPSLSGLALVTGRGTGVRIGS